MKLFPVWNSWFPRLITFVTMMLLGVSISLEVEAKTALFIVGNTTLSASDSAVKNDLNYYYTVTVLDDSAAADTSKDLIVISASVDPALVGTQYKAATKGVVIMKPELFDDMAMTAAGAFGTTTSQTQVKINTSSHQMAGGFSTGALVTVLNPARTVGWGIPASGAVKVALTADGNTSHATTFGYESGTAMSGITAPARRVGYYLTAADAFTTDGWKLFDYAMDWADGNVPPVSGGSRTAITWSSTITRTATGCDSYTPTWAPDGNLYTLYGDCNGLLGILSPKRSMGYGKITGAPATNNIAVADIDTGAPGAPDIDRTDSGSGLDATGTGAAGKKPSGMLFVNGTMYVWIRNITTSGTQSRLKYSQKYNQANATWSWAPWSFTEFGYPVFVQYGQNYAGGSSYVYVVAHDNVSAYQAADRFILMRVLIANILKQDSYEFFSGTPSSPAWVSYANRASRKAIFTSKGRCARNGMTYSSARGRYYWWQQIPPTRNNVDSRFFGGFGIYSSANPWGPWIPVYYNEKWDVGPGERGEIPTKWMSASGISTSGDIYLEFSGNDSLSIRKGTLAPGF
jgi:hypothetical protein